MWPDVCPMWHEWSALRTKALTKAVTDFQALCRDSKMKTEFLCCATPIPPKSLANDAKGTVKALKMGKAEKKEKEKDEDDYVLAEGDYVKSNLPFKLRKEIALQIIQKFSGKRSTNSRLSAMFSDTPKANLSAH